MTDARSLLARLRATFATDRTRPIEWRRRQLDGLLAFFSENEQAIYDALRADFRKPQLETYAIEIGSVTSEVRDIHKHLGSWMKPTSASTPLVAQPSKSMTVREPLGVVLVIAPWNYPVYLSVMPLAAALAAGNAVVLKPSELAPATSRLLAAGLTKHLDRDAFEVVEGGVAETTALLAEPWDHIFFTGSTHVGRIVMQAAAKHLTPVTLELGGKSPCIVDKSARLDVTAKRIAWGKFLNAGQTCVAPDYVLVDRSIEKPFLDAMTATVREHYGEDPKASPDFARIISDKHHARLAGLLSSGEPVCGGVADPSERYIAPTVLTNVAPSSPVMEEEIFGPILPVLPYDNLEEAIAFVRARPKPLALYVFAEDSDASRVVIDKTSSGGACINDAALHLAVTDIPFGGVGPSGMGAYHGRHGFETFSHQKGVLRRGTSLDVALRYPPYDATKLKWLKRIVK